MDKVKELASRSYQCIPILALVVFCVYPATSQTSTVFALIDGNETDRLALLALKDRITGDPLGILSSWNSSAHCGWIGVFCSGQDPQRVSILDLEGKKLTGSIPPDLGNLSFLTGINLNDNNFRDVIPQELGRLSRLRYLNLSENAFQGEIPRNLSHCSELEVINLNYNDLVGEIPFELSSLSAKKLKRLQVSENNLTGEIPTWLANASSLTSLSMADNRFHGRIPAELGKLENLQLLQIAGNSFTGTVPPSIYNMSSLLYLDMGDNQLQGKFPSDIGITLPNLIGLYIGRNEFRGSFPASLVNASGLSELDLSYTNLTGTLPSNLGSLTRLSILALSHNKFENTETEGLHFLTSLTNCSDLQLLDIGFNKFKGQLPISIGKFSTTLEQIIAGGNQISGHIPKEIENLTGLTRLVLSANLITGEIPAGIGNLERLEDLRLHVNRISGPIPSSFGNLKHLRQLYLHTNNLIGNIPASLGNCLKLELLRLYGNQLTGIIPKEVAGLSSITLAFNLANNFLTGPLPSEVGNMKNLYELNVSENNLTGEIPTTIGKCVMLEVLSLRGNLFRGSIPLALNALSSLHFLDLSQNSFTGQIPVYLQNLTLLQNVNLSFNNLEGEIPKEGIFKNTSAFSIVGNTKLCGGIVSLGLPTCESPGSNKTGRDLALKVAIPIVVSGLILLASALVCLHKTKRSEEIPFTVSDTEDKFRKVSYKEILQATNKFSSLNLIGKGQYGAVYKGILGREKMVVAVKVINLIEKGAGKSFISECNVLRNVRHRNLIKIITTCSSIDSKGADFKALIFEFMPNGSLEQWLHRKQGKQNHHESLNLNQRLDIAIDIASALVYMHHHCQTPIVHGDLKPSNILIDHDMTARVGDFGLARILSNIQSNNTQYQTNSTAIRGTVGYVAPEYGLGSKASEKGDAYSFGILLLEMFTGRRPTDSLFQQGLNLHQFAKKALPENAIKIVEPSLLSEVRGKDDHAITAESDEIGIRCESSEGEAANVNECLVEILKIGVLCSMESPTERMDIRDVVIDMCTIREKLSSHH